MRQCRAAAAACSVATWGKQRPGGAAAPTVGMARAALCTARCCNSASMASSGPLCFSCPLYVWLVDSLLTLLLAARHPSFPSLLLCTMNDGGLLDY